MSDDRIRIDGVKEIAPAQLIGHAEMTERRYGAVAAGMMGAMRCKPRQLHRDPADHR